MDYVDMLFVRMSSKAVIPTRATEHSVGLDFYSPSDYMMPPAVIYRYQHKLGSKFLQAIMED